MNNVKQKKRSAPLEEYVNMPLAPEIKSLLQERAAKNGRPTGREAAIIVTKDIRRKMKV